MKRIKEWFKDKVKKFFEWEETEVSFDRGWVVFILITYLIAVFT